MTSITDSDICEAVNLSGLKGFTGSVETLGGGEINDTFLLYFDSQPAVLRVAKYPDQDTLRQEARALGLLDHRSIPKLLFFDEKSRLQERQWILESYVPGRTTDRLNTNQLSSLGGLLAQVHKVKADKPSINAWTILLDACKMFGTEDSLTSHPDPRLRRSILNAHGYFNDMQAKVNAIVPSLVHGDATLGNTLVVNDAATLIDWEFSKFTDPMAEFSTIYYDDMAYNQGKWRIHITDKERAALFAGYEAGGGVIDEERLQLWMMVDKLGAAIFLYWRLYESDRTATYEQTNQYQHDLGNLLGSLEKSLRA